MAKHALRWAKHLHDSDLPAYLALADCIAEDIQAGRLAGAERLPPLRELARSLGLNYTTVARGYAEAQRRGHIGGRAGQGTFVRLVSAPATNRAPVPAGSVEMTMNLPPEPEDPALQAAIRAGLAQLSDFADIRTLLRYQEFGGTAAERDAGVRWLAPRLPGLTANRLLVCPGIQSALVALMTTLVQPGEALCAEAVTYPGVKAIAAQFGVRLHGLPIDEQGIDPDDFARACREVHPKALYLNPTLQNPTTATLSLERRETICALARRHNVAIIEDDAYARLPARSPAPLAALAPEITWYVSGLAKHLGAGLRIAYLAAPDARQANRLAAILRATTVMAAPITTALATRWIDDGTAEAMLRAIRAESAARQQLAARVLADASYRSHPDAFHLWLSLPATWHPTEFASQLRLRGVAVMGSEAFTLAGKPPDAVRVCLGGAGSRSETRHALELIADMLHQSPAVASPGL